MNKKIATNVASNKTLPNNMDRSILVSSLIGKPDLLSCRTESVINFIELFPDNLLNISFVTIITGPITPETSDASRFMRLVGQVGLPPVH